MKKNNILKKGIILISAYLIFAIYLTIVAERVERLNKIYHEQNKTTTTINVSE